VARPPVPGRRSTAGTSPRDKLSVPVLCVSAPLRLCVFGRVGGLCELCASVVFRTVEDLGAPESGVSEDLQRFGPVFEGLRLALEDGAASAAASTQGIGDQGPGHFEMEPR